jgi:hypothetical protein
MNNIKLSIGIDPGIVNYGITILKKVNNEMKFYLSERKELGEMKQDINKILSNLIDYLDEITNKPSFNKAKVINVNIERQPKRNYKMLAIANSTYMYFLIYQKRNNNDKKINIHYHKSGDKWLSFSSEIQSILSKEKKRRAKKQLIIKYGLVMINKYGMDKFYNFILEDKKRDEYIDSFLLALRKV